MWLPLIFLVWDLCFVNDLGENSCSPEFFICSPFECITPVFNTVPIVLQVRISLIESFQRINLQCSAARMRRFSFSFQPILFTSPPYLISTPTSFGAMKCLQLLSLSRILVFVYTCVLGRFWGLPCCTTWVPFIWKFILIVSPGVVQCTVYVLRLQQPWSSSLSSPSILVLEDFTTLVL